MQLDRVFIACSAVKRKFEGMVACPRSGVPLKEVIEFKYSKTKDNLVTPRQVIAQTPKFKSL